MQFRFAASSVLCKIYSAGYYRTFDVSEETTATSVSRWRRAVENEMMRQAWDLSQSLSADETISQGWDETIFCPRWMSVHPRTQTYQHTHVYTPIYVGIGTCSSWSQWNWYQHRLHIVPFLSRNFKWILTILNYRTVREITVHLDKKFV